jgi:hypothetical protein
MSLRRSSAESRGGLSRREAARRSGARKAIYTDPKAHPVHLVGYASQPDIQYVCDETWDQPAWTSPENEALIEELVGTEVHVGDKGRLYTFDKHLVTCEACKGKVA